jgi:hypothetical protein
MISRIVKLKYKRLIRCRERLLDFLLIHLAMKGEGDAIFVSINAF